MLEFSEKYFGTPRMKAGEIGPLKLAYLGDAVYELIVRTVLASPGDKSVKKMNKSAQELVNATTQARLAKHIVKELTGEEEAIYHRGRNAKSSSVSKHSDIHDYRIATGLEALFGYWYLTDNMDRAVKLLHEAMEKLNI